MHLWWNAPSWLPLTTLAYWRYYTEHYHTHFTAASRFLATKRSRLPARAEMIVSLLVVLLVVGEKAVLTPPADEIISVLREVCFDNAFFGKKQNIRVMSLHRLKALQIPLRKAASKICTEIFLLLARYCTPQRHRLSFHRFFYSTLE